MRKEQAALAAMTANFNPILAKEMHRLSSKRSHNHRTAFTDCSAESRFRYMQGDLPLCELHAFCRLCAMGHALPPMKGVAYVRRVADAAHQRDTAVDILNDVPLRAARALGPKMQMPVCRAAGKMWEDGSGCTPAVSIARAAARVSDPSAC